MDVTKLETPDRQNESASLKNKKPKRVILSVTNDLYSDQRVEKVCNSLSGMGFEVLLIGRRYQDSPELSRKVYKTKRLRLLFRKGPLFYAEFNIRLFLTLLFTRCDIFVANDLDTLLPNFLISKWKKKELVYDSHEYFCGVLEVLENPLSKKVWSRIEKRCFPHLKNVITVSQSIAEQYRQEYGIPVKVVRNIPSRIRPPVTETRLSLRLPEDKMIVILQGTGLHRGRGAEEVAEAVMHVPGLVLLIVGSGDAIPAIKQKAGRKGLQDKIILVDRVSPEKLFNYTYLADIGISLDRNVCPNHYFSLPNKVFEYIRAETPLIVSNLPERARIVNQYGVGIVLEDMKTEAIVEALQTMVNDKEKYREFKNNCMIASKQLTWENEEKILEDIYLKFNKN